MRFYHLALLVILAATPANAEWQGFDWGMTEAEIEAADSEIEVYRLETEKRRNTYPSKATLGGLWTEDGHRYQLEFYLDADDRLRDIDVTADDVPCAQQNDVFAERFGDYEEDVSELGPTKRIIRRWRLARRAVLMTTVIHFPKSDAWICSAMVKKPVGR